MTKHFSMHYNELPQDLIEKYKYAFQQAKEKREEYIAWIKNEIEEAITMISSFDFVYILGGLGSKHLKSLRTNYNQFLEDHPELVKEGTGEDMLEEDDNIEIILEYAMNITTSFPNAKKGAFPTLDDIQAIYEKLGSIKYNVGFLELASAPLDNEQNPDHYLRSRVMLDTLHVRGTGYSLHISEVYKEVFEPHNGFLEMKYGFSAQDLFDTVLKIDELVYSKVGNLGGSMASHRRFMEWIEKIGDDEITRQMKGGKHFIQQFTEANPDLHDADAPDSVIAQDLNNINGYDKLFWVVPQTDKEKLIFPILAKEFGTNGTFLIPDKFKAFPLNDTNIKLYPLISEDDKFYCFSLSLAYRNIFKIAERLIKDADGSYFENLYNGNASTNSKDNYIEKKVLALFQSILPSTDFYHSLHYPFNEDGLDKYPELDILGVSTDTVYIIEVKAGELNTKHKRGALKGLKDRLAETINEGSYQCERALKYISQNDQPVFDYTADNKSQKLILDKSSVKTYRKISITFEYFSSVSLNVHQLVKAGVLKPDYIGTWILPLYDLMVFADFINTEEDLNRYLDNREELYKREDVIFNDELDILGFFLKDLFPLPQEDNSKVTTMVGYAKDIDDYYEKGAVGGKVEKPEIKRKK